jgi:hypothetical protein
MGAAASTISKDQSAILTKTLKQKYQVLQLEGIPDAEIQAQLTDEFNMLLAEAKTDVPKVSASSSTGKLPTVAAVEAKPIQKNTSSRLGNGTPKAAGTRGGGGTRRRSFDGKKGDTNALAIAAANNALKQAEAAKAKAAATEAPAIPSTGTATPPVAASATHETAASTDNNATASPASEEQTDSWDSVTQQPFCTVCQMAFKSVTFLDRHVKYSDLHSKNVQKAANAGGASGPSPLAGDSDPLFPTTASGKLQPKQIEGKHYRLLYSGSKLFWRTQETVDLNIYHHIVPSTVEVVSYDTVKGKEMPRIYLEYGALCDLSGVTATAMATAGARAAAARAAAARDMEAKNMAAFGAAPNSAAVLAAHAATVEATAALNAAADPTNVEDEAAIVARYIIQRLQLGTPATPSALKPMEFVKLSSDTYERSPVLPRPPIVLIPIAVARRRRTNAEEIEATMNSLASEHAALVQATGHAHKVANLVYSSASSIASKKWWADFNPARRKWVWAIRRVIRQKLVAETKVVLAQLEAKRGKPL